VEVLVAVALLYCGQAEASARALKMMTDTATTWSDTIKFIASLLAPCLIIIAIFTARQGGHGMAVFWELLTALLVVTIIIFADEIVTAVKGGTAQAATGLLPTALPTWSVLAEMGRQLLTLAALTQGVWHVRRARRV
jgi:hypothetical protein